MKETSYSYQENRPRRKALKIRKAVLIGTAVVAIGLSSGFQARSDSSLGLNMDNGTSQDEGNWMRTIESYFSRTYEPIDLPEYKSPWQHTQRSKF